MKTVNITQEQGCTVLTHSWIDEPCQIEALLALGLTFGPVVVAMGIGDHCIGYTVAQRDLDIDFVGAKTLLQTFEEGWKLRDGVLSCSNSSLMVAVLFRVLGESVACPFELQ